MPRTDGEKTRQHILQVAEKLFAENGFDGTSVDRIADTAGVNKALIYYYFKDKDDILVSLFKTITQEVETYVAQAPEGNHAAKLKEEILFLSRRKKILSILLMEVLKTNSKHDHLAELVEMFVQHTDQDTNELPDLVYEFFTGFIPVLSFIVFQDRFCERFGCQPDELLGWFMQAMEKTHLSHP